MSGIGSILLHLDATAASPARLTLARGLADLHGAAMTALFGIGPQPDGAAFAYSAGAALRAAEEAGVPHARERNRLRGLIESHASACLWCDVSGDSLLRAFVAEALYADLLILGPPASTDDAGAAPPGFVESLILAGVTPAIIVPHTQRQETIGDRALIAWNGSAAAAHAVKAALPLLRKASHVHVATWTPHPPSGPFSRLEIVDWLARHGIEATMHRQAPVNDVAGELAALAAHLHADILVMGCYGHSRWREQVFGGVTRKALATLSVPILMAH